MYQRHRDERAYQQRQRLAEGAERYRALARQIGWMRVDVVDGQTVVLDGGTTVLVITDRRREAMIKWTRALDNVALAELAELLDVASRTQGLPTSIQDRLLRLAEHSDVDTDLHPPRRGLNHRD